MVFFKAEQRFVLSTLAVVSLVVLSGCFSGNKSSDNSTNVVKNVKKDDVLLSVDGKTLLTVAEYEQQKAMTQQANPQFNMILQMMPQAEYDMLFKGITQAKVMKEWVVRNKIDQTDEFKELSKQLHDSIDMQLYAQKYRDNHKFEVSDSDLEAYYNKNKTKLPWLKVASAGVAIKSVSFDSKADAEKFYGSVKGLTLAKFEDAAKDQDLNVSSMSVSEESHVSAPLKNRVLEINKFPAQDIIKVSDKSYWVIFVIKREDAKYHDLETPNVKTTLKRAMQEEREEAEVDKLKEEYKVVENKDYFDKKMQDRQKAVEKAQEIAASAQKAGKQDAESEGINMLDITEA